MKCPYAWMNYASESRLEGRKKIMIYECLQIILSINVKKCIR